MTFNLILSYKYNFLADPFVRDKSREPIKTTREFTIKVGIAFAEVALELQGSFTLGMHFVLNFQG